MKTTDYKKVTMTIGRFFELLEEFHTFEGDELIAALMRSCYKKNISHKQTGGLGTPIQIEFANSSRAKGHSTTVLFMYWDTIGEIVINDLNKNDDSELSDVELIGVVVENGKDIVFTFSGLQRSIGDEDEGEEK